jgi:oxygen-independent coproporphyrinogen-3 oxidase
MKHCSESFNKQSRLIVAPALQAARSRSLAPAHMPTLKARLVEALQVQQDFFPCFDWVFPPPVFPTAPAPDTANALFGARSVEPGTYAAYLHIPFCQTLCSFCYYRVLPGRGSVEKAQYVDALLREMAMYREALAEQRCESVYIGGGTPTALDDEHLVKLFEGLRRNFRLDALTEISIESAPGTIPRERVALLRELGVNRLSYGIQSLDETLLSGMNRHYSVAAAMRELEDALPLIGNLNVDTMYGFAGEADDALARSCDALERLGVPSLSIYSLDTQRSVRKVMWIGPPRDDLYYRKIDIFQRAKRQLESRGYRALLQNIFVQPGRASFRHQLRRWENVSLVALGIGSMGYAPRKAYRNVGTQHAYVERLAAGRLPIEGVETLSPEMEFARQLTTQLRFARVNLRHLRDKYGVDMERVYADLLRALTELGYLDRDGDELSLSDAAAPYNNVLPMLFAPDSFKAALFDLPEEYLETMPIPQVLTRLGATQSASLDVPVAGHRPPHRGATTAVEPP